MFNKNFKVRMIQKHDISDNWKSISFIPLKGEVIVYDDLNKIKIGDGVHDINQLKFLSISYTDLENTPNLDSLNEKINTKLDISTFEEYTGTTITTVEPKVDDIPIIYIDGVLPTSKNNVKCSLKYQSKTDKFDCYILIKCQGTSSMNYPKKNYTIKLYKDSNYTIPLTKNFKEWGSQSKFCLKANWMDFSHARNIGCARLWSDLVKSRPDYSTLPEKLRNSPNNGAIDGFPVLIYCNGIYWGRYTLNIPKGDWMAGMDSESDTDQILSGENYISGCFRAPANIDGTDWSDELHDTVPENIKTRWNEVINFVMNSSDEDFKNNISNYFDLQSLIDYFLFSLSICHLDGLGKNQLFFSYDNGQHWMASAYDMDSTMGLYWNGSAFVSDKYVMQTDYETGANGTSNLLYERLHSLFIGEIRTRWKEVKETILSPYHIIEIFQEFCDIVPKEIKEQDYDEYTGNGVFTAIPNVDKNNFAQIRNYAKKRYDYAITYLANNYTLVETILQENYLPETGKFILENINPDFNNNGYFEFSIDVSKYTDENDYITIISLGEDISAWKSTGCYHIYFKAGTNELQVNKVESSLTALGYLRKSFTLNTEKSRKNCIIKINLNGVYVNGELALAGDDIINNLTTYQLGAAEGNIQPLITYNYIKQFVPEIIPD